jgi:hypothetical protein
MSFVGLLQNNPHTSRLIEATGTKNLVAAKQIG